MREQQFREQMREARSLVLVKDEWHAYNHTHMPGCTHQWRRLGPSYLNEAHHIHIEITGSIEIKDLTGDMIE